MTQKCMEPGCEQEWTDTLLINLTDRDDLFKLCHKHYEEAKKELVEVEKKVDNMSRDELIGRLKELKEPEEFEQVMKEIGENIERWNN